MTAGSVPGQLAAACPQVRRAAAADSCQGVAPSFVAAPASPEEASAVLAAASALGLAVLPRGTGGRLGWGAPPRRCDLVLETRLLNRVLEHEAGDLVVRVQAGLPLPELAAVLAAAGQRLALDPPAPGSPTPDSTASDGTAATVPGTVGGVLATGVAGPLRLRYGAPRDLLIGITVVLADGTVARSGGKVVKNVAGYDLGKLFAGSYGTLGLIAEATFRLHPLPGARAFVTLDCPDAGAAHAALTAAVDSPLTPSAAEIQRPSRSAPVHAGILLEGDADGVSERCAQLRELLGGTMRGSVAAADSPPPWWGRGPAAAGDATVLRIAFWAGELTGVLAAVDAAAAGAGLDPAVGGSAAAGVLHVAVPADAAPTAVAGFLSALRGALPGTSAAGRNDPSVGPPSPAAAAGPPRRASAVVLHAPAGVRDLVDIWGPVPSLALMRAVKDQFDPGYLMSPGRFAGGI
jgi:glycolate oxidase FAD binding subunit